MAEFRTPPEIPAAVLPTVEHHQGDWLFYTWKSKGTETQLQWVSPSYRPPLAGWQVFCCGALCGRSNTGGG